MSLPRRLSRALSPGLMAGITLKDWLHLLRDNAFDIDARYVHRASIITMCSLANSILLRLDERIYGDRIRATEIQPPLFLIGHARSGTTLLHQLFAVDRRFATPNRYQERFPHTFLCTESLVATLTAPLATGRRAQDNVLLSWRSPAEDEGALCVLSLCSTNLGNVFPRRWRLFSRYKTLQDIPAEELARWKASMIHFYKKLSLRYGRPLIIKSPFHAARIRLLAEMFPRARFVYIHRNPYDVFHSMIQMFSTLLGYRQLQEATDYASPHRSLSILKEAFARYSEDKLLLREGQLAEVRFEDLERDPVSQLRSIYAELDLFDFQAVEPALRRYVESTRGYRKNVRPPLPDHLRQLVARELRQQFETWGYPI